MESTIKIVKPYLSLIRPKHWIKNLLIFIPIIYAHNLNKLDLLKSTILCFLIFCLISSAVYVINDIVDLDNDRLHPVKNMRPIASGQIKIVNAVIIAIFLIIISFLAAIFLFEDYFVFLFVMLYLLTNIVYSLYLKHYTIIDCFCIAAGFVFRVYAGGAASNSRVSEWLFLTMMVTSLCMAFAKRRGEIIQQTNIMTTRKVLLSYDLQFLNGTIYVCASLSIIFYSLWAMNNVSIMIYTVPFVIYILYRYLLIIHGEKSEGDPTLVIFGNASLLITIIIFGILSIIMLYM